MGQVLGSASGGRETSARPLAGDDRELVERASEGDRRAFEQLYRRHARAVYAYAAGILRDPEEAEEVTQDTFVTAWERLREFHLIHQSALPWLLVTCRYKSLNRYRSLDRQRSHRSSRPIDDAIPDDGKTPDDSVEAAELLAAVDTAVAGLSEIDQSIYRLCLLEDMTYTEAATALGASSGSVRNRLSRLRGRLRNELSILRGSQ
ncbi:MAG: polymerase, sigma-24 subunit, subfamily [Microbacteriaceae bacterium]|jgi:RNA polymerase sigma factor (sigma-70 family)|nr:polymerase, sigma-24 subunit, subfamily [Microbacteriaceae bacterium]